MAMNPDLSFAQKLQGLSPQQRKAVIKSSPEISKKVQDNTIKKAKQEIKDAQKTIKKAQRSSMDASAVEKIVTDQNLVIDKARQELNYAQHATAQHATAKLNVERVLNATETQYRNNALKQLQTRLK